LVYVGSAVKVLYFSRGYTPHDYRFLSRLAETNYAVYFMHMEEAPSSRESRPIPQGITKIAWDGGGKSFRWCNIWKNTRDLERVLKDLQPNLVHAGPVQETALLTALTGYRPLITMSWGSDLLLDGKKGFSRWLARYTLERSTVFICDSDVVSDVAQEMGVSKERIIQFPWGVDLDHFSPGEGSDVREALGWEGAKILLCTRNWEPIYGVDIVCRAFVELAGKDENVNLLLLGDGSLRSQIERLFRSSGLEDRVHLAGFVNFNALPEYYRTADLYISASHVDGSSISLLEAMACGIPAIVSDIPGNRQWVTPGENGWWFPDGSSKFLTETILEAIQDLKRLKRHGEKARQIAEERADWDRNSRNLLDAYQLALSIERELS
jgi:glycosyltransferase involved in cell wall biosynthesis